MAQNPIDAMSHISSSRNCLWILAADGCGPRRTAASCCSGVQGKDEDGAGTPCVASVCNRRAAGCGMVAMCGLIEEWEMDL